jgi:5-methyltetrahydropteroyltriglutamate--homocysteine methyltransferase
VASLDVETPEQVAQTLRQAMAYAEPERIFPCTNCGMAPLPRHVAEGKLEALGAGAKLLRRDLGVA